MPFLSFLLACLFSASVYASPPSVRDEIIKMLPEELTKIDETQTRAELEKKFADKIQKKEDKDALYLQYFEKKNDVTIGFKKDHFQYLYIEFSLDWNKKIPGLFERTLKSIPPEELKKQEKKALVNTSHESGRYLILDLPKQGLKLEFLNNENKDLRSVIMWKPGRDLP